MMAVLVLLRHVILMKVERKMVLLNRSRHKTQRIDKRRILMIIRVIDVIFSHREFIIKP
jgi:hypothetical protein